MAFIIAKIILKHPHDSKLDEKKCEVLGLKSQDEAKIWMFDMGYARDQKSRIEDISGLRGEIFENGNRISIIYLKE